MSGSGREALLDVRDWLGGPPGCLGVVLIPSRMSGSCTDTLPDVRKDLPKVRERSGGPTGCPGVVGRPFQMFGSGLEALLDVWE